MIDTESWVALYRGKGVPDRGLVFRRASSSPGPEETVGIKSHTISHPGDLYCRGASGCLAVLFSVFTVGSRF